MISPDYVTKLQNLNRELIKQLEEAERPQGEWIFSINHTTYEYPWGMYKCSKCGNWEGKKTDICPNCDAQMVIQEDHEDG